MTLVPRSMFIARAALSAAALAILPLAAATPAAAAGRVAIAPARVGQVQVVEGFAVTPRAVVWAREAGTADYVAARGHIFLLVRVDIKRSGGHGSYYADRQDFVVQTSRGDVVDAEQFGVAGEFASHHVYSKPVDGWIGFEVPAGDRGLRLLWQPAFAANPDATAQWAIGGGATVQYYR